MRTGTNLTGPRRISTASGETRATTIRSLRTSGLCSDSEAETARFWNHRKRFRQRFLGFCLSGAPLLCLAVRVRAAMIRTGEEHRFGCARPRVLMSVGGAANCFYESVTPLDQYGASIPCRRLWRRGPQGQALLRLVRRGASEPTDNVAEPVRCRLANAATGSDSADFERVADLPLPAWRRRRYRFDNKAFFPVFS